MRRGKVVQAYFCSLLKNSAVHEKLEDSVAIWSRWKYLRITKQEDTVRKSVGSSIGAHCYFCVMVCLVWRWGCWVWLRWVWTGRSWCLVAVVGRCCHSGDPGTQSCTQSLYTAYIMLNILNIAKKFIWANILRYTEGSSRASLQLHCKDTTPKIWNKYA